MESLEQFKKSIEKINSRVGSVIEMSPEVWEILGTFYNEENVFVTSIEVLSEGKFKIKFVFPEYDLTKEKLGHVSGVQMQLAIFQGLYIAIGLYIKNNPDGPISYEDFLKNRNNALYRRDSRTFSKMLKTGEEGFLIFEIDTVKTKGGFHSVVTKLVKNKDVFISGDVECVLARA